MRMNIQMPQSPCRHVAYELHKLAHKHYMDQHYMLEGSSFTMDDREGLEEAIIAAFLNYTDLEVSE